LMATSGPNVAIPGRMMCISLTLGPKSRGAWHLELETTWRARRKWEKADAVGPGNEREACTVLADGYANLGANVEALVMDGARR